MHVVSRAVVVVAVVVPAVVMVVGGRVVAAVVQGLRGDGGSRGVRLAAGGGHRALGDVHDEERDEDSECEDESSCPSVTNNSYLTPHGEHHTEVMWIAEITRA